MVAAAVGEEDETTTTDGGAGRCRLGCCECGGGDGCCCCGGDGCCCCGGGEGGERVALDDRPNDTVEAGVAGVAPLVAAPWP